MACLKNRDCMGYDLFLKLYFDRSVTFIPMYEIVTNFRVGGMSSSALSYIETNSIRYNYGLIIKWQRDIGNIGIQIKRRILSHR